MNSERIVLQTMHLSKKYQSGALVNALTSISISVSQGEFVSSVGPSGSGKSTLLNILGTLDFPSSGSVFFNGRNIHELKGDRLADFRRENIGFVFQLFNLVPTLTALENVMLPLVPYKSRLGSDLEARAETLLKQVGLGLRFDHLPGQLSGGEQQRVAIARALINNPVFVLADEPTGNLDSATGKEILALLQELNKGRGITMILVTHDPNVASEVDRFIYLRDGRVVSDS